MVDAKTLAFVLRGKNRVKILKLLGDSKEMISSEIENKTGMYKSHVSRTLKELYKKRIIDCENPSDRIFRFYKITTLGQKILKRLNEIDSNE